MRIEGAAVAGIGMVRFDQYPERSTAELARDAGLAALHDAGITLADVDEAFVGYLQPAAMIGIKAMKELGLTGLPVTHVENASATGLVAFREAAWAVASGRAEVAMAIAFDKMTDMARGGGGSRGTGRDRLRRRVSRTVGPYLCPGDVHGTKRSHQAPDRGQGVYCRGSRGRSVATSFAASICGKEDLCRRQLQTIRDLTVLLQELSIYQM